MTNTLCTLVFNYKHARRIRVALEARRMVPKLEKIIDSCITSDHLVSANRCIDIFYTRFPFAHTMSADLYCRIFKHEKWEEAMAKLCETYEKQ